MSSREDNRIAFCGCGCVCLILAFVVVSFCYRVIVDYLESGSVTPTETVTNDKTNTSVISPAKPPQPPVKVVDRDTQLYEELVRARYNVQVKIEKAKNLYSTQRRNVHEQRTRLMEHLGDKSIPETIDLFREAKAKNNKGIPSDLDIAYSYWLTLLPDESHLEQITEELDTLMASRLLEEWDVGIKEFENKRASGNLVETDRSRIDRLLVRLKGASDPIDNAKAALYEDDAIKKQKIALTNWE